MREIWKRIFDYKGLYSVSNFGRVRREPNTPCCKKGRILRPQHDGQRRVERRASAVRRRPRLPHDMNSVMEIGDYIMFIYEGNMVWDGTKEEIINAEEKAFNDFVFANNLMRSIKEQMK